MTAGKTIQNSVQSIGDSSKRTTENDKEFFKKTIGQMTFPKNTSELSIVQRRQFIKDK